MPFIAPGLAVAAGLRHTELHILDGGGRSQLILELEPEACRLLSDVLQTIRPIETITVEAEEVVDEQPTSPVIAPFDEPIVPPSIDWDSLTKQEIVNRIELEFGEKLDISFKKAHLIDQATQLEWERNAE